MASVGVLLNTDNLVYTASYTKEENAHETSTHHILYKGLPESRAPLFKVSLFRLIGYVSLVIRTGA